MEGNVVAVTSSLKQSSASSFGSLPRECSPGEDQLCVPIAFGILKKTAIFPYGQRESMCHLLAGFVWDFIIICITVAYYSSADWTSFKVNKNVLANCYFESD